jgi:multiple sugar transport system substrate-binding protein
VPTAHRRTKLARTAAVGVLLAAAPLLAACGSSANAGGPVTLNFYSFPDNSGAVQQAVTDCTKQSGGKYVIKYNRLPNAADGQRDQLVRRLAAHFSGVDIMGLDVTWEPEFAEAGWILPWTGANKAAAEKDTLEGPLDTAIWNNQLVAVPYNSNTELLWYRSDLVPTPPTTWAQMIADSEALAKAGKPHLIEIQGAQYEGAVVWFNTLLASAGGSVLTPNDKQVSMGAPAVKALSIMKQLASSPAADPSLSVQMEDANRLAMEAGTAAFELNYPFVYPSMKADQPALFKNFKWAPYPGVIPGQPAKVTIGGIDLAVSKFSQHQAQAFSAIECLRNPQNEIRNAVLGGLPPVLESIYSQPKFQKVYPMWKAIFDTLKVASVRPKTPAYQSVSLEISYTLSPPTGVSASDIGTLRSRIDDAINSRGLVP